MVTFPLWFKIFLVFTGITILSDAIRYLALNKVVKAIIEAPTHKREKTIKAYSSIIKIYKIYFWAAPLNLLFVPYAFYKYIPDEFFHMIIMISFTYIFVIEDFFYKRSVVSKIREQEES